MFFVDSYPSTECVWENMIFLSCKVLPPTSIEGLWEGGTGGREKGRMDSFTYAKTASGRIISLPPELE